MNATNASAYLPLIHALAEGKTIQVKHAIGGTWHTPRDIWFDNEPSEYRIVEPPPEPSYRAWDLSEVPLGAQVRVKGLNCRTLITAVDHERVYGGITTKAKPTDPVTTQYLLEKCEYSTDNGATWSKCGVKI